MVRPRKAWTWRSRTATTTCNCAHSWAYEHEVVADSGLRALPANRGSQASHAKYDYQVTVLHLVKNFLSTNFMFVSTGVMFTERAIYIELKLSSHGAETSHKAEPALIAPGNFSKAAFHHGFPPIVNERKAGHARLVNGLARALLIIFRGVVIDTYSPLRALGDTVLMTSDAKQTRLFL